ncbi:DUF3159 domain-containing protein [Pseudonocardia sp. TRM90224]|uniref:DUF3159 domain-containing protein n=1 Tax=Pseudonocardia sp. TRM90224 TaxID=2812678 RepID=UPI001E44AA97|nr:DUF3159 domain-containing protein [Pseudonocardia sp. TRM90224]
MSDAGSEKLPETFQDQLSWAWNHVGGVTGTILTTIPILAFVVGNAIGGLWPAIWFSIGSAVLVGAVQLLRKEKLTAAIAGLGGAVFACAVALVVGAAKGYYLWGIWVTLAIGCVLLLSVVVRWPLIGVIWSGTNLQGMSWRKDRASRTYYDVATMFWVLLCFVRYAVQSWLYGIDETTWLGIARVAMGWPLTLVAALVTIWAVRNVDRRRKLLAAA